METIMRTTSSIALVLAALVLLPGLSQSQDQTLTDEAMIASAEGAAPISLSRHAEIMVWEAGGRRVIREGTNGWWCIPDNTNSPAPDPLCGDANSREWLMALMEHREPGQGKHGTLYALLGAQLASNTDPFAVVPPEGSDWITVPPHVGTVFDPVELFGRVKTANPDVTMRFIAWYDTPYAHLRQPMGR
jgi:hypothetical protein